MLQQGPGKHGSLDAFMHGRGAQCMYPCLSSCQADGGWMVRRVSHGEHDEHDERDKTRRVSHAPPVIVKSGSSVRKRREREKKKERQKTRARTESAIDCPVSHFPVPVRLRDGCCCIPSFYKHGPITSPEERSPVSLCSMSFYVRQSPQLGL